MSEAVPVDANESIWAAHGSAASVDWCEPNFVVTPWVAEWWNTLSSLPIAAVALYGLYRLYTGPNSVQRPPARFTIGYVTLAIIGLGSAAFHGTLLKSAQALDELPMIYCSLVFLYCLIARGQDPGPTGRRWAAGLTLYSVVFTIAYALFPTLFALFIFSYAAIVAGVTIQSVRVAWSAQGSPRHKQLITLSIGTYLGGVALLWMPEHVFFPCDHAIQAVPLHALFHLTSAMGTYTWLLFLLWDFYAQSGRSPRLVSGLLPWVEASDS